jgi:hypothetical protein
VNRGELDADLDAVLDHIEKRRKIRDSFRDYECQPEVRFRKGVSPHHLEGQRARVESTQGGKAIVVLYKRAGMYGPGTRISVPETLIEPI